MNQTIIKFENHNSYVPIYDFQYAAVPLQVISTGVARWDQRDRLDNWAAAHYHISMITCGNAVASINGENYKLETGDIMLLSKGAVHSMRAGSRALLHKRYVVFDGILADTLFQHYALEQHFIITPRSSEACIRQLRKIYHMCKTKPSHYQHAVSEALFHLILDIGASAQTALGPEVFRIIRFMDAHLDRKLTLKQICDSCGISSRSCNRLFQKYLAATPIDFFNQRKCRWVQTLMQNSWMPLKQIAYRTGFDDQRQFSMWFRKMTGISPREFRRKIAAPQ